MFTVGGARPKHCGTCRTLRNLGVLSMRPPRVAAWPSSSRNAHRTVRGRVYDRPNHSPTPVAEYSSRAFPGGVAERGLPRSLLRRTQEEDCHQACVDPVREALNEMELTDLDPRSVLSARKVLTGAPGPCWPRSAAAARSISRRRSRLEGTAHRDTPSATGLLRSGRSC